MKKNARFYWKLFLSTFYISAFTFGGGYVIIPLMRKKFVDEFHWIEEKEMLDLTAIAQSSPGAIAVNASILIGYRLSGIFGAFLTILATILPPMVILSIVSLFYTAFRDSAAVSAVMRGMQAGVAAVIADVVITMAAGVIKERSLFSNLLMIAVFLAAFVFNVNVIIIILTCGALGATVAWMNKRKAEEGRG